MEIVRREVSLLNPIPYSKMLSTVEQAGRNCYQSQNKIAEGSAEKLVRQFIKVSHGTPLEFAHIAVKIVGDRSLMGQITRHRLASFCIESARYNNYTKEKYGKEISVIVPHDIEEDSIEYHIWEDSCLKAEDSYFRLINHGVKPEMARSVLPMSLATNICMSANVREWRHILKLRLDSHAQSDIREVAGMILQLFYRAYPVFFEDLAEEYLSMSRNITCKH